MKIVFITLYYKPIWPGLGTRSPELWIDEAAKSGHEVTVYTGRISKKMQVEEKYRLNKLVERMGSGYVKIERLWTPDKHEGTTKRTLTYLIFILQCFFRILFSGNIDLLMGMHPYPPFFLSIQVLAKLKKIKFVLEEADLWPDQLWELGVVRNRLLYSLITKWSVWAYNLADVVIVITDELKNGLKKYFKNESKIEVLQLATNTEIFKPLNNTNDQYQGKFVVMYSGIISINYDFDIILDSAKELVNKNILFVISGAGELKEEIKNKIEKQNLKNVVMEEPLQDIKDLVDKLNRADILVIGMNDNMQANTAHPSKVFEFMACGKPLICSTKGATRDLLIKSGGGMVVDPGDHVEFSKAIMNLYNSPLDRKILGKKGLEYIRKYHSLSVFRNNLSSLLNRLS